MNEHPPYRGVFFRGSSSIACNVDMRIAEVYKLCKWDETSESLLRACMNLSARAYHRILKLARTIADFAESE